MSHTATTPTREGSVRYAAGTINRNLISLPTELLSTTNVNALNAPNISDLNGTSGSTTSSNSSIMSGNDSDFTTISRNFIEDSAATTPASSVDTSPVSTEASTTVSFFDIPQRSKTSAGARPSSGNSLDAPALPKRALSHSKKAHVELSRKRSTSRLSPPPTSLAGPTVVRNSVDIFAPAEPGHPFGKELAQVNEVAEEFGLVSANLVEEEQDLISRGFRKFGVADYLDEIGGYYGGVFEDKLGPMANPWF